MNSEEVDRENIPRDRLADVGALVEKKWIRVGV